MPMREIEETYPSDRVPVWVSADVLHRRWFFVQKQCDCIKQLQCGQRERQNELCEEGQIHAQRTLANLFAPNSRHRRGLCLRLLQLKHCRIRTRALGGGFRAFWWGSGGGSSSELCGDFSQCYRESQLNQLQGVETQWDSPAASCSGILVVNSVVKSVKVLILSLFRNSNCFSAAASSIFTKRDTKALDISEARAISSFY